MYPFFKFLASTQNFLYSFFFVYLFSEFSLRQLRAEFAQLKGSEWLAWNLESSVGDWDLIFGVTCWFLWGWRNKGIFEKDFNMPTDRAGIVRRYVAEIKDARGASSVVRGIKREVVVRWKTRWGFKGSRWSCWLWGADKG
ncbi:hypothetical protein K1719_004130 [Acacia pycnantha]|nr:hypothetical protein K1719_004130 [Acacia pycnantha]